MEAIDTYFIKGQYKDGSEYFESELSTEGEAKERIEEMRKELSFWNIMVRLDDGEEFDLEIYLEMKRLEKVESQRQTAFKKRATNFSINGTYYP